MQKPSGGVPSEDHSTFDNTGLSNSTSIVQETHSPNLPCTRSHQRRSSTSTSNGSKTNTVTVLNDANLESCALILSSDVDNLHRGGKRSRGSSMRFDSVDRSSGSLRGLAPTPEGYKSLARMDSEHARASNLRGFVTRTPPIEPDPFHGKSPRSDLAQDCKRTACLANLALGVGYLGFNTVFFQSGWIWSSALLVFSTLLLIFTAYVVGKSSVYYKVSSLRDLVDRVCGRTWGVFFMWTVTLLHFSVSVICVAVGGHAGRGLMPDLSQEAATFVSMAVMVSICVPLSMRSNPNNMTTLNGVGVFTAMAITGNLVWLGSQVPKEETELKKEVGDVSDWFGPVGVVVFSLMMHSAIPTIMTESHSNVTPLISNNNFEAEALMHGSQFLRYVSSTTNVFPIMLAVGSLTFVVTTFSGIFGSMKFMGESITDIVDKEQGEHPSLSAMVAISALTSCPLLAMFTFVQFHLDEKHESRVVMGWYILILVAAFCVDVYGPEILNDISIIFGFSSGSFIALALPGILLRDVNGPFRQVENVKQGIRESFLSNPSLHVGNSGSKIGWDETLVCRLGLGLQVLSIFVFVLSFTWILEFFGFENMELVIAFVVVATIVAFAVLVTLLSVSASSIDDILSGEDSIANALRRDRSSSFGIQFADKRWLGTYRIDPHQIQLIKKIGSGSEGQVWKGMLGGCLPVAVKQMYSHMLDTTFIGDLQREAKMLSELNHPGVVRFFGVSITEDRSEIFIITELCKQSLQDLITEHGKEISFGDMLKIMADIAEAMRFLHSHSVIHRDCKPANILLDELGNIKICDMGLAFDALSQPLVSGHKGTPGYKAPELILGEKVSFGIDVFAFAMLCHYVITQKHPIESMNKKTLYHLDEAIIKGERPRFPSSCPITFQQLVARCWNSESSKRPSFEVIRDELSAMVNNTGILKHHMLTDYDATVAALGHATSRVTNASFASDIELEEGLSMSMHKSRQSASPRLKDNTDAHITI